MSIGNGRDYYFQRTHIADGGNLDFLYSMEGADPDRIRARLQQLGVTHLFVWAGLSMRLSPESSGDLTAATRRQAEHEAYVGFRQLYLRELFTEDGLAVYEIRYAH